MAFDTRVEDMVVLVTDKEHPRYGQIGKMLYHDWVEYGGIGVEFSDGHKEEFHDGVIKGDPPSKIKRFYRHVDSAGTNFDNERVGPAFFQREFTQCGGDLENLTKRYKSLFNEDLPQMPTNSE